jgi:hypothetical protein
MLMDDGPLIKGIISYSPIHAVMRNPPPNVTLDEGTIGWSQPPRGIFENTMPPPKGKDSPKLKGLNSWGKERTIPTAPTKNEKSV